MLLNFAAFVSVRFCFRWCILYFVIEPFPTLLVCLFRLSALGHRLHPAVELFAAIQIAGRAVREYSK